MDLGSEFADNATCGAQSIGPANQLLGLLIQTILSKHCALAQKSLWPPDYGPIGLEHGFKEYDFIIVGAGSAGSVLANRLTENSKWNVLLLEAGDDPPIESEIPMMIHTLWNTTTAWKYYTEKSNDACIGSPIGCFWPRGKLLGGSSSLNVMIYVRGNKRDYDRWLEMGNPTWGWTDVIEYFKKSENIQIPYLMRSPFHKTGGLLSVDNYHSNDPLRDVIIKAGSEIGIKLLASLDEEFIGLHAAIGTLHNRVRCSTAKAFLQSARDRPNLHVVKNAHVTKIHFSTDGSAVSGVEFILTKYNRSIVVKSKKETILSAGSIETPHLLMLSGVGPKQHLQSLNIPLIQDLPVGQNLQDHVTVPLLWSIAKSNWNFTQKNEIEKYFEFLLNKSGFFSSEGIFDMSGYLNADNSSDIYPDIQFFFNHLEKGLVGSILVDYGYDSEVTRKINEQYKNSEAIIVYLILLNPRSRGSITLRNTNPFENPIINANYFNDTRDLDTLINGIHVLNRFLTTSAFHDLGIELIRMNFTNIDTNEDSNKYWKEYVRYFSSTAYHPVGTAKMGPINDQSTVVDSKLSVKGINNLRVIDASIMPTLISGNTNAPVIMIGEKGADFIKEDWTIHTEF